MAMRRRAAEGVALVGSAGTFWYLRIRDPDPDAPSGGGGGGGGATPSALSPRTGAPLQLMSVQVAFRHGARLPNQDVLHPGESGFTGPAAWTTADTAWDPAEGIPFRLNDYKMKELPGGAEAKRITNSSRHLKGGGNAGRLSALGWHQTIDLGVELRARYVFLHENEDSSIENEDSCVEK